MIINKIQECCIHFFQTNHFIILKIFNSEFETIEVWFMDQNSQPLEIEEKINLTLVIK